ncbi:MAG: phosphate ABC transporter permease subunit PstC [Planctomycetota bacterium]|jgi:phosphate transport system permease protein|nr:phosphate ABC transporter permease subunit PstC [Planctomycetota bacterium]
MKKLRPLPNFSRLADWAAEAIITIAGLAVILTLAAMPALMLKEAAPLFLPPGLKPLGKIESPEKLDPGQVAALIVSADLSGKNRAAGLLARDGRLAFAVPGEGGMAFLPWRPLTGSAAAIRQAENLGGGKFSLLREDGVLNLAQIDLEFASDGKGGTVVEPAARILLEVEMGGETAPPLYAMLRGDGASHQALAVYADGTVREKRLAPPRGLLRRGGGIASEREARIRLPASLSAAALNRSGDTLYLGTGEGDLIKVDLSGDSDSEIAWEAVPAFPDRRPVTALAFLNGDYALAVGDGLGGTSVWFPRRENGEFRLRRAVAWPIGGGAVEAITPSLRDRSFLSLRRDGSLSWFHSTTARELLAVPARNPKPGLLAVSSRGDNLLSLGSDGNLEFQAMDSAYPEAGWNGFFRRLLYEGYERAAFVWQSTAPESGEPKLSLVPLVWGSVKAAAFAMLFATPLALAAAVFLSQFAPPAWRACLKPVVEMLAAVPSVVVGFLAALWLAPLLESRLRFFLGDQPYDQRNSLVIAVALGFAVIPNIFSLAEDAISAVPNSLAAAALALGASKWQAVRGVVLPAAAPGIFTAVMFGLGRAVGETMIVLMAAGNTPIISLSPYNGMRTLSANIAVEMPEAPVGGVLFRTLFLCSLLLFALTLGINLTAEILGHRLRRKYGSP